MKVIDRYLIKSFLCSFFCCLTAFICLYLIIDLISNTPEFVSEGAKFVDIANYYRNLLPDIYIKLMPVSTLIGIIITLNYLNKHNELMTLWASGVSSTKILMPFLLVSAIISLVSIPVSMNIAPKSMAKARYIWKFNIGKQYQIKKKIWSDFAFLDVKNRIVHVGLFNAKEQSIRNIQITQYDENYNIKNTINAKEAKWINKKWMLFDGLVRVFDMEGSILKTENFKQLVSDITETPRDLFIKQAKLPHLDIKLLKLRIKSLIKIKCYPYRELTELHSRISLPFSNLVMVIIAFSIMLAVGKRGKKESIGIALSIGFIYYGIAIPIILAIGRDGTIKPWLAAWLATILFAFLHLGILIKVRK